MHNITLRPAKQLSVLSSPLQKWSRHSRQIILSQSPQYHDVSAFKFSDQFPRPEDGITLDYLNTSTGERSLSDLLSDSGSHVLMVASVARNYIGIRDSSASGANELRFGKEDDFYRALFVLSSDLFFKYWRTVGDGFHVTKANILDFPVHSDLDLILNRNLSTVQRVWTNREKYKKCKLNSGRQT